MAVTIAPQKILLRNVTGMTLNERFTNVAKLRKTLSQSGVKVQVAAGRQAIVRTEPAVKRQDIMIQQPQLQQQHLMQQQFLLQQQRQVLENGTWTAQQQPEQKLWSETQNPLSLAERLGTSPNNPVNVHERLGQRPMTTTFRGSWRGRQRWNRQYSQPWFTQSYRGVYKVRGGYYRGRGWRNNFSRGGFGNSAGYGVWQPSRRTRGYASWYRGYRGGRQPWSGRGGYSVKPSRTKEELDRQIDEYMAKTDVA